MNHASPDCQEGSCWVVAGPGPPVFKLEARRLASCVKEREFNLPRVVGYCALLAGEHRGVSASSSFVPARNTDEQTKLLAATGRLLPFKLRFRSESIRPNGLFQELTESVGMGKLFLTLLL